MSAGPIRPSSTAHTVLHPVTPARISGGFRAARRRTDAEASIPQGPRRLEEAGILGNLRVAATGNGAFTGDFPFQDSDVHKWLEAASWRRPTHLRCGPVDSFRWGGRGATSGR
ncbi:hypothetical protein [Streptomyces sp. NPDC048496]|uniref:hypothetical protein n=1 Tax=Streptomyces sp. NPDC048496 TaxID=3365558 RepID=UPI00372309E4